MQGINGGYSDAVRNSSTTATSNNTASAIVARDSSGNFIAGKATLSALNLGNTDLTNYTEGNWTPIDSSGAGLTLTVGYATYMRIGTLVICHFSITYPSTADASAAIIGGLPFTAVATGGAAGVFGGKILNATTATSANTIKLQSATTTFTIGNGTYSNMTNANLTTANIRGYIIYKA